MPGKTKKKDHKIIKKRSGRYAVVGPKGKYLNGEDKVKVLVKEGILKIATKKEANKKETPAE